MTSDNNDNNKTLDGGGGIRCVCAQHHKRQANMYRKKGGVLNVISSLKKKAQVGGFHFDVEACLCLRLFAAKAMVRLGWR